MATMYALAEEVPLRTCSLAELARGVVAKVTRVDEPGASGERLMELGLISGAKVRVVRRGLFGDPLQIEVRGTMLSLRKAQAERIALTLLG